MSTGFDVSAESLVAQLSETVERGASLLAGGPRLAGPAGIQDAAVELIPGTPDRCVGLGLVFSDGTAATVAVVHELAMELCGGVEAELVVSGLQVVAEQLAGGSSAVVVESVWLADGAAIVSFLGGRSLLLGAGVFDGENVVATVGAAAAAPSAPAGSASVSAPTTPAPPVAPASNPGFGATGGGSAVSDAILARGLALLAEVNLELTVELGRAHLRVSDLLGLEPGSVIDLDREAGSPVDLLVNGMLFARAEVIVVENNYAVRITELVAKDTSR